MEAEFGDGQKSSNVRRFLSVTEFGLHPSIHSVRQIRNVLFQRAVDKSDLPIAAGSFFPSLAGRDKLSRPPAT